MWAEPALIAEWLRLLRGYADRQVRTLDAGRLGAAMRWSEPAREAALPRERAITLTQEGGLAHCAWGGRRLEIADHRHRPLPAMDGLAVRRPVEPFAGPPAREPARQARPPSPKEPGPPRISGARHPSQRRGGRSGRAWTCRTLAPSPANHRSRRCPLGPHIIPVRQQIGSLNPQDTCELLQHQHRRISNAAFDPGDIGSIQPRPVRQFLLRQAGGFPESTYV